MSKSTWMGVGVDGERSQSAIRSWFSPLCDEMTIVKAEVLCDNETDREKKIRAFAVDKDGKKFVAVRTRGELAFITAQFGERDGQAPRVHGLGEPAPVGVTLGNGLLIEPTRDFDILFRMLEPHELAAAMGFNTEDTEYEFAGTKTEKIKQIGNAVSVSKMKACVGAILADAAAKPRKNPIPMTPAMDERMRA
jgi:site-specific DNA-cytosine methylase